jgi:hypothetical protein
MLGCSAVHSGWVGMFIHMRNSLIRRKGKTKL